jgi:hypothetical protein
MNRVLEPGPIAVPLSCRLRRLMAFLMLPLLAACAGGGGVEHDCSLAMVARLPIKVQANLLTVPIGIDGHWVWMVVDTGAQRTTLSVQAADRLGLRHDSHVSFSTGVGGVSSHADVVIDRLFVGGARLPVPRFAVSTLNFSRATGLDAEGLLGADILLAYEMDIDVPNHTLTLYRARSCAAAKPDWAEPAVPIEGIASRGDRMLIPFSLDGVGGLAILDTGAQRSVVGIDMARRLGLTEQSMAGDPAERHRGAGPGVLVAHVHQFRDLRIGPAAMTHPFLSVLPAATGIGDALVGEDFLEGRRIWLDFPGRRLWVSPLQREVASTGR